MTHQGVLLDASFLIRLANEQDELHLTARAYFDQARKDSVPLYLSSLVVAEFEIKQVLSPDVRKSLIPAYFDFADGKRAAETLSSASRKSAYSSAHHLAFSSI